MFQFPNLSRTNFKPAQATQRTIICIITEERKDDKKDVIIAVMMMIILMDAKMQKLIPHLHPLSLLMVSEEKK